jgi:hypothetical protein
VLDDGALQGEADHAPVVGGEVRGRARERPRRASEASRRGEAGEEPAERSSAALGCAAKSR